ncbi:hypothetical protein [Cohnella sp. GbtcB17]|uniref:hypothetical protein n=1 Tax=Cohnella sp. GbtcB17 TaxID=2824762 RepID=UPI001C2FA1BE|nr:hypothetical protein [Cohnella sp. GbtcB17]
MNRKVLASVLKYASLCPDLKTKDYKVLLYLLPKLRGGEFIKINQGKIADDLEIAKTDVSRSVRKLINNEIIQPLNIGTGWKLNIRLHPYTYEDISGKILEQLYEESDDEDENEDEVED